MPTDPAIEAFLSLLDRDLLTMAKPMDQDLLFRMRQLVEGVEVDLDKPLDPEDD